MNTKPGILVKKNKKISEREVKIQDGGQVARNLMKAGVHAFTGNLSDATENVLEASEEIGLRREPGEIAWLLICNSLTQAIFDLVNSNQKLLEKKDEIKKICENRLNHFIEGQNLYFDENFVKHPKQLPILEEIKGDVKEWLENHNLDKAEAQSISDRLPGYFPNALHQEWNKNKSKIYGCLEKELNSPFNEARKREYSWLRYGAFLQKQVEEPIFLEEFGLNQIYVPLCAYYNREVEVQKDGEFKNKATDNKICERVVVELENKLETWLNKAEPRDAIRVISGGPGSGKSSFAKIFAAKQAEKGVRVLFIPLHQFNLTDDLVDAVGKFLDSDINNILPANPLSRENAESRLLIIFDGLDELAMQGKAAKEVAQQFVREVDKKVDRFNNNETRLQVLITGRELIVQANSNEFRKPEQILHILPYFVTQNDEEKHNYKGERDLLKEDKRDKWWENYGLLKGKEYNGLPEELGKNNLIEVTSQPLLNYLVALSFIGGKVDFSQESNLNLIYADLLKSVYKRVWENERQHPTVKGLDEENFVRILEEIALSSWHGDGRTTTVRNIEDHCDRSGLKTLLENFQKKAEEGVTSLLLAFYFRQSGSNNKGDKTFEFTHKSFGEYLTAIRIVREVRQIHKKLKARQEDPDEGWDKREALKRWANLCGASAMDEYLFNFVLDEMRLQSKENPSDIVDWQQTLCDLISFMLRHGMPMELLDPRPKFHQENQQARNAEEALLVVLNACARVTNNVSHIEWSSPEAFGTWISRLQGQRVDLNDQVFSLNHLSFLNLKDCILYFKDFYGANLEGANLEGANLVKANLVEAHLKRANLVEARLERANLEGAHLEEANLMEANLEGAYLEGAHLEGANLEGAHLKWAHLEEANLEEANLVGANLEGANLENVRNHESANFKEANLKGTVLEDKVET